ncbi:hypothetical protein MLD38_013753 [Melastoma candidum]|nr:hypothetical protein MLD38_013753 [Melastoma candidum]
MAGTSSESESLLLRIRQLERERDDLHKDIEQLCMQQAGSSYLVVATKMHFQRTAGLEQEIETLKGELSACKSENENLQEELSEAYRMKSQMADLHRAEVTKNLEAEKQLKFFQGCVAAAFAERDQSIMEAEKAKEKEDIMFQKFKDMEKRMEGLNSDCVEQKKLLDQLQTDLTKQREYNETFQKVVDKFYKIRQQSFPDFEDASLDDKCLRLLEDSGDTWSYNDKSTFKYISALEEELQLVRSSVDDLQSKLRVGLEIENHLKKKVRELEKKKIIFDKMLTNNLVGLRHQHSLQRMHIKQMLQEESSYINSVVDAIEERMRLLTDNGGKGLSVEDMKLDTSECSESITRTYPGFGAASERIKHELPAIANNKNEDASKALAQALKEKVATLLLLSQQEERHLLERNVNVALRKRIDELQRNLFRVTNEKVKALMELAQLRQDHRILQMRMGSEMKNEKVADAMVLKGSSSQEQDGKLKNLLKKTYLNRWISKSEGGAAEFHFPEDKTFSSRRSSQNMDFARMKVEIATLRESLESMDHLTSLIHRLRLSLLQANESVVCGDELTGISEALEDIISEARLLKTALGSSLPLSWSAGEDLESSSDSFSLESGETYASPSGNKADAVSAAGFEMVELLILASQILKEKVS